MDSVTKSDTTSSTRTLCEFLSAIRFEQIPAPVIARTEELFLDWFASALAGKDARPTRIMEKFAAEMGPRDGDSETKPGDIVDLQRAVAGFRAHA